MRKVLYQMFLILADMWQVQDKIAGRVPSEDALPFTGFRLVRALI